LSQDQYYVLQYICCHQYYLSEAATFHKDGLAIKYSSMSSVDFLRSRVQIIDGTIIFATFGSML